MEDEAQLVEALRAQRPGAFERAYTLHSGRIYGFLLRLSRRRDVADDLFQETWIRLQRYAPRLLPDTRLLPWLLTVARNLHVSHARWRVLDMSRFFEDDEATHVPSPEGAAEVRQELAAMEHALGRISSGARELLLLSAIGELDPTELQVMLKLAPDAYRQRLSRARKELKDAMTKVTGKARIA